MPFRMLEQHLQLSLSSLLTSQVDSIPTTNICLTENDINCIRGGAVLDRSASFLNGLHISDEGRAVLFMSLAMAMHYLGYSFARPTSLSLFTSKTLGFSSAAAFPFAMAFVSPASLLLLMLYGNELHKNGPRIALRHTTLFCSFILIGAATAISLTQNKIIVGLLFIFREAYVQLLTSQMWSFMASVLTPSQSATWFAPISGLTSISSALAGMGVGKLVDVPYIGLLGVMALAGISLLTSLWFSECAYSIAIEVS